MYKWRGRRRKQFLIRRIIGWLRRHGPRLPTGVFDVRPDMADRPDKPYAKSLIFEGPTVWLGRLHCHLSHLQPGAGYAPHADRYDVAIVLLSGSIETGGKVLKERGIAYFGKGEQHGMRNPGSIPATYLVFELAGKARKRKRDPAAAQVSV